MSKLLKQSQKNILVYDMPLGYSESISSRKITDVK